MVTSNMTFSCELGLQEKPHTGVRWYGRDQIINFRSMNKREVFSAELPIDRESFAVR